MRIFSLLYALSDTILTDLKLRPLFDGMSDITSGSAPVTTYYVRVGGMRIRAGTDLITVGAP